MSISIKSDYSQYLDYLQKLQAPMRRGVLRERLDTLLQTQFQFTQAAVHIQTGSLKSSGKSDSDATASRWKGFVSYGGPSKGVHNPVKYAEQELSRGQDHDYMTEATDLSSGYGRIVSDWLSRG